MKKKKRQIVANETERDILQEGRINGKVEKREIDGGNERVQMVEETD